MPTTRPTATDRARSLVTDHISKAYAAMPAEFQERYARPAISERIGADTRYQWLTGMYQGAVTAADYLQAMADRAAARGDVETVVFIRNETRPYLNLIDAVGAIINRQPWTR
jgi:hypothetical protein